MLGSGGVVGGLGDTDGNSDWLAGVGDCTACVKCVYSLPVSS